MKIECLTFFIYGMCVMFYSMMVWMFWRKGNDKLSRLIMLLMVVLDLECLKDLALYLSDFELHKSMWHWVNATDMVVVPVYTFVLMELVKPGWLSWRKAALHEASFLMPLLLYGITDKLFWFDVLTAWCFVYGTVTYFLMFYLISRYHRQLKERFSYQDNINLNWLRGILSCFFVILLVWVFSCYMVDAQFDNIYMLFSLGAWMFVCYFLYKHESVIEELGEMDEDEVAAGSEKISLSGLEKEINYMLSIMYSTKIKGKKITRLANLPSGKYEVNGPASVVNNQLTLLPEAKAGDLVLLSYKVNGKTIRRSTPLKVK